VAGADYLLGPPEFHERFAGRYFGTYRALVKRNDDPRQLGRVKVYCSSVYGSDLSPWAFPCMPMGSSIDGGSFWVPPVDSLVWIEFEQGYPTHPIYKGGFWTEVSRGRPSDGSPIEESDDHQDNANPVPGHSQGLPDGSDLDGSLRGQEGVPRSNFQGTYPKVRVLRTESGHVLEFDDTTGQERIQIAHRSGSFIEMLPDGSINIVSAGRVHQYGVSRSNHVAGNERNVTQGSRVEDIDGDWIVNVGGAYRVNYTRGGEVQVPGMTEVVSGDKAYDISGSLQIEVLNNIGMTAGGHVSIAAMGDFNASVGGKGQWSFSNALNQDQTEETLSILAQNGRLVLRNTDLSGLLSNVGLEMQALGSPLLSPTPRVSELGPFVRLGDLSLPMGPVGALRTQEPMVMGMTLTGYLQALQSFLSAWLTDYLAHAHPWFSPSYTAAVQAGILPAQLAGLASTYLAPAGAQLHPAIVSDLCWLSK